MYPLKSIFYILAFFALFAVPCHASPDLSASRNVEATADSSVAAKNRAVAEARKSLTADIIRRASNDSSERLEAVLEKFTDADAQVLVRSMSIENERRSATTYAALIRINLDRAALADWFTKNDLSAVALNYAEVGWTPVHFSVPDGLTQWKWLNTKLRDAGVQNRGGVMITKIGGNQIYGKIPDAYSRAFATSLRGVGASVWNSGGTLRITLPAESSKPE